MKNILMATAAVMLLSTGFAMADGQGSSNTYTVTHGDGSKTVQYDTEHKTNLKKCWKSTGNWVGGKSFTSCEFKSGGTVVVARIPAPSK